MRAASDAMQAFGIDAGDPLVIDRAITAAHAHVVIAVADDVFTCRQLFKECRDIRLRASKSGCAEIVAGEGAEFQRWGVVAQVIKSMAV